MTYCLDEWKDVVSVFFEVDVIGDDRFFASSLEFSRHGRVILSKTAFSAQRLDHNPLLIKGVDHDFLLYERYFEGIGRGLVDDTSTWVNPDWIQVVDMSRRFVTQTSNVRTKGVVIPHDLVGYDPSRHPCSMPAAVSSHQGRLLDLAHGAMCQAIEENRDDADVHVSAFLSTVRTHLMDEHDARENARFNRERLVLAKTFIDRNLRNPSLSVDLITAEVGISRASLYRIFEADGGVAKYIADCRLDRCIADLKSAAPERGQVRRIAEQWGFYHPGNFNRMFRARFDASPSDCIGTSHGMDLRLPAKASHPVHQWLQTQ